MTTLVNHENEMPEKPSRGLSPLEVVLSAATGLALLACVLLAIGAHTATADMSAMRESTHAQLAAISTQIAQTADDNEQRIESLAASSHDSAASVENLARAEVRKTNAALSAKIAAEAASQRAAQNQIAGQLSELREADSSASSKLDAISGDVTGVKGDVASTQSDVQTANSELKRVNGDMGVMSGLIATNGKELAALRELGERNYTEFSLKRTSGMQKVANLQLALSRVDPKRNRFTLDVLADDKRIQKRDKTINEPVQMYLAGYRQPVEIVVNEVRKDEVVGYLAVPKIKASRP
jgi:chromosome segregation ATPase